MSPSQSIPVGIAIPQVFTDGPVDMALVRDFAQRAEALGYHSLWVQEQNIGGVPVLESLGLLGYLAALTRTIRLGSAVTVVTLRNPVHLAKTLGSLDQMSGGRLIAGLALGGRPSEYPLFGAPTEARVTHFVEALEVMKALWRDSAAQFQGRFWQLDGVPMEPKPVQRPHPTIWLGGRHPDALRRSVRHADGWIGAGSTTTAQFQEHVAIISRSLDRSGRDPTTFDISKRVYIAIDDDADRAERRLRRWFGLRYGNEDMASRVSVWGTASRCAEQLGSVVAAGAQMLMLNPVFDHMEHVDTIASEIAPLLTGAPLPKR